MELNERITKAIVERREELGMSRYELAKRTGITYNRLMNIEKGDGMTIKSVDILFDALGLEFIIRNKE